MQTFVQFIESYNRNLLNVLMTKLSSKGLLGRDIQILPEEMKEISNVSAMSRSHIQRVLQSNKNVALWLNQYEQWEQTHGNNLVRFTFPNSVVKNGGSITNVQATDKDITVPNDLYTILSWMHIIDSLDTTIKQIGSVGISGKSHPSYGISSVSLYKTLLSLSQLLKSSV